MKLLKRVDVVCSLFLNVKMTTHPSYCSVCLYVKHAFIVVNSYQDEHDMCWHEFWACVSGKISLLKKKNYT